MPKEGDESMENASQESMEKINSQTEGLKDTAENMRTDW